MTGLYIFGLLVTSALIYGGNVHEMEINQGPDTFSWNSCNTTAVPMAFSGLSISPNPIKFGADITFSFTLEVTEDIGTKSKLEADIDLEIIINKSRFNLCDQDPKSCHTDDLCELIAPYKDKCPEEIQKVIPCHCPLKKKTYSIKDARIHLPEYRAQINGQFNVTINIRDSSRPVGCVSVHFCLGTCT